VATSSRTTARFRFVTGLAAAAHAILALACYALHARALLGWGLEKWVVVLCFVSAAPGMIAACILLDRAGVNPRDYARAHERRLARERLHALTGSSSWPWSVRIAFGYAALAFILPTVAPKAHGQAVLLSLFALFHVILAVVLFRAFRWLGKSAGPSAPIPSR